MWIVAIPIVLIVLVMVYQYALLPKMKAKHEEKLSRASDDFALQIAGKEAETKTMFIQSNEHIKPIVFQIQEQDIMGIISCQEKRETKDFLRQQAVNIAGKALGRLTGVGVREVDNTEHYFLVLTHAHLHYLHYSDRGDCKEHLSFERNGMENLAVGKITSADMLKNNAFVGETERLTFESGDTQYNFFFYDKMYAHPKAGDKYSTMQEMSKVNYLFAKPFLAFVKQYQ